MILKILYIPLNCRLVENVAVRSCTSLLEFTLKSAKLYHYIRLKKKKRKWTHLIHYRVKLSGKSLKNICGYDMNEYFL